MTTQTTTLPNTDSRVPPAPSAGAIEALYATGHWLYSQQRFSHAATVFRALIHVAPRDERGWLALGACHESQEQSEIALELYGAACAVASGARLHLARARLLRARGDTEDARDAVEQAERIADDGGDDDVRALVELERRQPCPAR